MTDAASASPAQSLRRARARVFYGWWIVLAAGAVQVMSSGLLHQAYGSYMVLLRSEFGWGKTFLSGAYSMMQAEAGILGPIQGTLLDRFGPRAIMRVGVVLLGSGFILFSQVRDPVSFYLVFIMMAIGLSMCGHLSGSLAIVNWFFRRRATALSVFSSGHALGGMAVPLVIFSLETIGWRATALCTGVLFIAAGIPLASVIRSSPEEIGEEIDGTRWSGRRVQDGATAPRGAPIDERDFTFSEALRTRQFWFISLGHGFAVLVVGAVNVHFVSHVTESMGYSLAQASLLLGLLTTIQFGCNLAGGFLGDRFSKRYLAVGCMLSHGVALAILAHAGSSALVLTFVVLHGVAWGIRGPQMSAIRADYFGRAAYGRIVGVSNMIVMLGSVSGPVFAGLLYDSTGNYMLGFDILAGLSAAGCIFFVLASKPTPPEGPSQRPVGSLPPSRPGV